MSLRAVTAVASIVLVLAGCGTRQPAPIEDRAVQPPPPRRSAAPAPATPKPPPVAVEGEARAQTYTVKRGDTLYLIALDHGLDYRELAAWNNIENVNIIRVGQVLRLTPADAAVASVPSGPGGVITAPLRPTAPIVPGAPGAPPPGATATSPPPGPPPAERPAPIARNSDTYKTQPKAIKEPYSERALREMQQRVQAAGAPAPAAVASAPASPPAATSPPASASPPAGGSPPPTASAPPPPSAPEVAPTPAGASPPPNVVARADPKLESRPAPPAGNDGDGKLDWVWPATGKLVTGFSDTANLKGIDIAGKAGQPVLASSGGKVVYAGTGLRGYGKLIIIKHNNDYLSAYAHNQEILVKEGQQVQRGQKIAEMGSTDADQVKLHFEIRRLGKPMDPLKYLPPA